jgi:hypothetical protein
MLFVSSYKSAYGGQPLTPLPPAAPTPGSAQGHGTVYRDSYAPYELHAGSTTAAAAPQYRMTKLLFGGAAEVLPIEEVMRFGDIPSAARHRTITMAAFGVPRRIATPPADAASPPTRLGRTGKRMYAQHGHAPV